uniref:Uncharacterized protein n=1 Tax=Opuntia streptacantha TaxID=393608 RepID=A0A7C9ENC5_OPUST
MKSLFMFLIASLGSCLFLNPFDVKCPLKFHLLHLTSLKQIGPSLFTNQATLSLQQILTHCFSLIKPSFLPGTILSPQYMGKYRRRATQSFVITILGISKCLDVIGELWKCILTWAV